MHEQSGAYLLLTGVFYGTVGAADVIAGIKEGLECLHLLHEDVPVCV